MNKYIKEVKIRFTLISNSFGDEKRLSFATFFAVNKISFR